jgi:hypothetical protein
MSTQVDSGPRVPLASWFAKHGGQADRTAADIAKLL